MNFTSKVQHGEECEKFGRAFPLFSAGKIAIFSIVFSPKNDKILLKIALNSKLPQKVELTFRLNFKLDYSLTRHDQQ